MNIVSLFPTPVGQFKFARKLTDGEYAFMSEQEKKPNMGNTISKDCKILEHEQFKDLREFVDEAIHKYFDEVIKPEFDVKLRITQSWLNYTEPGQYHHKHAHPNSVLSAVFYVDADPEVDKIYFYSTRTYKQISFKPRDWNLFNSESWWLPVSSGDLVVFPSHFEHSVEVKSGNNTRISLALNTFPVGYVGDDDSLTGLHL
jgi:uncharacterized protein (TIGR02466 family)